MGLLRKAIIISSGGLAPIRSQSYAERQAKAAEKALKLQQQQARQRATLQQQQGRQRAAAQQRPLPLVADELTKLAQLRDQGVISLDEFETQKRRLLAASQ